MSNPEWYEFGGQTYNVDEQRHGGPWDRGSADSYYRREESPHFYVGATHRSSKVVESAMTLDQINEYRAGYSYNESNHNYKEW